MKVSFLKAAQAVVACCSLITLSSACGTAQMSGNSKHGGNGTAQQASQNLEDCYGLGGGETQVSVGGYGGSGYTPNQNYQPSQQPYQPSGKTDVTVTPPNGKEPNPPAKQPCNGKTPSNYPNQNYPGQPSGPCDVKGGCQPAPCDQKTGCQPAPCDQKTGCQPAPAPAPCNSGTPCPVPSSNGYPGQMPIQPDQCGKNGQMCVPYQGPAQWPTQTVSGGPYDQGQFQGCMDAFHNHGYDVHGQWGIEVRDVTNVSVLSTSGFQDMGHDHVIVMLTAVNVLGEMHFDLLNPNALYCVENVSVLEKVFVTSCYQNNVVFGSDVRVLSGGAGQVVPCY